jgi:hypothetical protein
LQLHIRVQSLYEGFRPHIARNIIIYAADASLVTSPHQLLLVRHGQLHALQQVVVQPVQRAREIVHADAHHRHRLGLSRLGVCVSHMQ